MQESEQVFTSLLTQIFRVHAAHCPFLRKRANLSFVIIATSELHVFHAEKEAYGVNDVFFFFDLF